jgi:hypothetical protein
MVLAQRQAPAFPIQIIGTHKTRKVAATKAKAKSRRYRDCGGAEGMSMMTILPSGWRSSEGA